MSPSKLLKIVGTLWAILLLGACSSTIRPDGGPKNKGPATWEESRSYFLFGLVGEHDIDAKAVCADRGVDQIQTRISGWNALAIAFTLGLYAPKTALIWCR